MIQTTPIEKALKTLLTLVDPSKPLTRNELEIIIQQVVSFSPYKNVDKNRLMREYEANNGIIMDDFALIADEQHHKSWLSDKKSVLRWQFWHRYYDYLREEKKFGHTPLTQLDLLTDEILNRLFDPTLSTAVDKKGLVVGQVQSGKTSNYSGLICKAADAGFKLIIVLAGVHNNLRSQTQLRIDEGFLGFDTKTERALQQHNNHIGVGKMLVGQSLVAHSLTTSEEDGDFSKGALKSLGISFKTQDCIILVVKKNTGVLKRLHDWLASNALSKNGVQKRIESKALLLIDDEADHASVNTAKDTITRINQRIRAILNLFTRSAYVGYTATPFANIFIPIDDNDLFPKDFIVNLTAPSNYIGPEKVFGYSYNQEDKSVVTPVLPIIHNIRDFNKIFPDKHKIDDGLPKELPDSLKIALKCFILTCAVRRVRQQVEVHNSMLVHVTRYKNWQTRIKTLVEDELAYYKRGIEQNAAWILAEIKQIFETDQPSFKSYRTITHEIMDKTWESVNLGVEMHDWDAILPELHAAAAKIEVKMINGGSADVLNYFDEPKGVSMIAIGGDKLSRGLTLEGLSISYYLRSSKMYDTLMQMGRWFGYRKGYIDLCRLFTSVEINEWYCHIALASNELREDFEHMKDVAGATPTQYALKVRTHPSLLQITASNKMRSAVQMQFTFSGQLVQTYLLKKDRDTIEANLKATQWFINQLNTPEKIESNKILWRTHAINHIIAFLDLFRVHPNLQRANPQNIIKYIKRQYESGELTEWVIAMPILQKDTVNTFSWQIDHQIKVIPLIKRSEDPVMAQANDCYYANRGHLLSPRDEFFDLEMPIPSGLTGKKVRENNYLRPSQRALLLLYPLSPIGILDETDLPMMGIAISFPKSQGEHCVGYAVHEQLLPYFKDDETELEDDYDEN